MIDPTRRHPGRSVEDVNGRSVPLAMLKYWAILVPLLAGAVLAWQSHRVLPKKLFLDESIVLRFASGELRADGFSSYGTTGWLYRVTGLESIPDLFPVLAYLVFAGTVLVAITWRGIPDLPMLVIGLAAGSLLLGAVFLSQYSKEFFVVPLAALLLLARRSMTLEVAWIVLALVYAAFLRQYWFLVVGIFLAFRIASPRLKSPWLLLPMIMIGFAIMIVVFQVAFGAPLTFFRVDINKVLDFDRSTQIDDLISGTSFTAQWINAGVMMLALAFPVSLLASGQPVQLIAGGFLALCWMLTVIRARHVTGRPGPGTLPLAFLLSFLMVQTVFEPDFGSYLRHITPQLPVFLALFVATGRRARDQPRSDPPALEQGPEREVDDMFGRPAGSQQQGRPAVSLRPRGLRRPMRRAN